MTLDDLPELVNMALGQVNTARDELHEQFNADAPGSFSLNDDQFTFWYLLKRAGTPYQGTSPEGVPVQGSSWELALPYCEGGKAIVQRWERIVRKELSNA